MIGNIELEQTYTLRKVFIWRVGTEDLAIELPASSVRHSSLIKTLILYL